MPTSAVQPQVGTVLVRFRPIHGALSRRILPRQPGGGVGPGRTDADALPALAFLAGPAVPATPATAILTTFVCLAWVTAISSTSALVLSDTTLIVTAHDLALPSLATRSVRTGAAFSAAAIVSALLALARVAAISLACTLALAVVAQPVPAAVAAVPGARLTGLRSSAECVAALIRADPLLTASPVCTLVARFSIIAALLIRYGVNTTPLGTAAGADSTIPGAIALILSYTTLPIPTPDDAHSPLAALSSRAPHILIHLPTTVIIDAVAHFGSQVRNRGIQRLAVRGIEVPVVVVIQVTEIAHSVIVGVLLLGIRYAGAVVFVIPHFVPVFVGDTVHRAAVFRLIEIRLTLPVPAPFPAIRRARLIRLREPAGPVSAEPAVHWAFFGSLVAIACSVTAGRVTVLSTVVFGFAPTTNPVAASCTI